MIKAVSFSCVVGYLGIRARVSSTLLLQQYPRSTCSHISIILSMLCPLASKRITQPSKHAPPFVQKKKKKLIRALIPPKYPSPASEPPTELPYQTAHPTSCISLRISNQNPTHAVIALQPDRIERKLSRAVLHLPFTSVVTFKIDACLESLHGGHLPYRHPTSQSPHQRAPLLSRPMSHARLEENTDKAPPLPTPSPSRSAALSPCICAPSIYLPKRPCSSHPSSPSLSAPLALGNAFINPPPPPPSFSRQQRPARAEWQTGSIQQVGSSIDGLDRYI